MEPASGQDQSGLLKAATVLLAVEDFDGPVDSMGFDAYQERVDELPETIESREDYDDVQRSIGLDKLEPEEIQETWNSFVADEFQTDTIANGAILSQKAREGNVGSRYGVPTYEFPVECRSCGENPRIDGSMFCPSCHPELDEDDVNDEELVTEKYEYDYHSDKVEQQEHENPDRHEMNKEFSLRVFRVLAPEDDMERFDSRLLGLGVDFENSDVYVDWNNEVFPDPLDGGHVSIYSSVEDLEKATGNEIEYVREIEESEDVSKQSVDGHPEIPVEDTAPEAVEFLERMEEEGYDPSESDDVLLYKLLGTGTPEWKMSKEDSDYKQEPEGDEICANCQYYYEGTDGEGVCSKVRGEVYPEHWCRLWEPGDNLKEEKTVSQDRVNKLFNRTQSNSKGAHSGDNSVDKFLSGFGGYPKKTRQRGAQLGNEHIERLDEAFRQQVWPDELQKAPSWTSDDDVTEDTKEWVKAVLQMEDPIYDEYDNIPMAAGLTVKQELEESLTQGQGWSLNSIESRLREEFPQMESFETERIARQEVAGVLNRSKIVSLMSRPDDPMVKWVGPEDSDTTQLCEDLKNDIGDGVPFSELMSKLEEYAGEYKMGTPDRVEQGLVHWLCRHSIEVVDDE